MLYLGIVLVCPGTVYLGILYLDIVYPGFWLIFEWVPVVTVFWMGRGNEWSGEEDAALRALVGLHGCRWAAVAAVLGTRSADSARCRWKVVRALVSPVAVGVVVGMPEVFPWVVVVVVWRVCPGWLAYGAVQLVVEGHGSMLCG